MVYISAIAQRRKIRKAEMTPTTPPAQSLKEGLIERVDSKKLAAL
jgi:hypothetical protein